MKRRDFLKAAAATGGASIAIACAPASTPTPGPASGTSAVAVKAPKRGGILKWQNPQTPGIDLTAQPNGNTWIMQCIYDRLLSFRAQNFNDMELAPSLAEKWETSADGLKITLTLRKGVTWQNIPPVNGREFTSDDVKWNHQYYLKTPLAFLWNPVVSVDTPDKYTAVLNMKAPAAQFMVTLGDKNNMMYPREVHEKDGNFKTLAIGTGPFQLKSWKPNVEVILEARKDYWQNGVDGKPLPYLDGIESYVLTDYNARVAGMRAGQYDEIYPLSGALRTDAEELKKLGLVVTEARDTFAKGLLINQLEPIMQDVRVRQAINKGLDRKGFIGPLLDGAGRVADFIPLPGWNMSEADTEKHFGVRDVDGAKKLIADAGKTGAKVTISTYTAGPPGQNDKAGAFIAANLKDIGLDATIDTVPDFPTFSETRIIPGKFMMQPLVLGSGGDPDGFLAYYLSTEPVTTNRMRVRDPKLDQMILNQRTLVDPARRKTAVTEISNYLLEQMYGPPLPQVILYTVRQPWVQRAPDHLNGIWRIEQAWIDK